MENKKDLLHFAGFAMIRGERLLMLPSVFEEVQVKTKELVDSMVAFNTFEQHKKAIEELQTAVSKLQEFGIEIQS